MSKTPKKPNNAKAVSRWENEGGAPTSGDRSTRKKRRAANQPGVTDLATGEVGRGEKLTADERFAISRKAATAR